jgi:heat-inducible transcriptional repressor
MADLYEDGYLAQPHTSAGRVPTSKAFQSYVNSLAAHRVLAAELHRLRVELLNLETMQARVERSSHILMQMTHGLGIAAAIPTQSQTLDQIDLLALADRRILMIVATRDHMVRNRVVTVNEHITQEELHSIRNYLNHNFSGWGLSDIQRELEVRLKHERAAYDAILTKLTVLYEKGLLEIGLVPEIHIEGASNLIGLDLHLTREKMRELFQALEQKKKILTLLDRFLEEPGGEIAVRVGLGEAHSAMAELSLIGIAVTLPGGISGKIAVLGPMRMDYEKVISAVLHVGRAFGSVQV